MIRDQAITSVIHLNPWDLSLILTNKLFCDFSQFVDPWLRVIQYLIRVSHGDVNNLLSTQKSRNSSLIWIFRLFWLRFLVFSMHMHRFWSVFTFINVIPLQLLIWGFTTNQLPPFSYYLMGSSPRFTSLSPRSSLFRNVTFFYVWTPVS